jgi:hypothetical protein
MHRIVVFLTIIVLTASASANSEAKTMSDPVNETPLSAEELRKANYVATLALRGGETVFDGKQLGAYLLLARSVFESAAEGAARSKSSKDKDAYLRVAYMTAYNIASNTWPGWNEGAIEEEHQEIGMRFSRTHMKIVEQMDLAPQKRATALWIGAAHELAAKNYETARSLFRQAKSLGEQDGNEEITFMNQGWLLVVDILQGNSDADLELKELKRRMSRLGDDGKFYAGQYDGALRAFRN